MFEPAVLTPAQRDALAAMRHRHREPVEIALRCDHCRRPWIVFATRTPNTTCRFCGRGKGRRIR